MSFYKTKLVGISRDLYLEHGWEMPRGIAEAGNRNPTNFSLAEWQQAKRQGVDPRIIKEALQSVWARSDNARSFAKGLEERGYYLARGDKRSFVVLGYDGEVHSLPRALGLKTKEVVARLGDGSALPSVAEQQKTIAAKMTPAIRRHIAESRIRFGQRSAALGQEKEAMTRAHRGARVKLTQSQAAEWLAETKERSSRLPKGLSGLWHRITGKYQEVRTQNETEAARTVVRHAGQQQALIESQHAERRELQAEFKTLRKAQAEQLLTLRREVGRYLAMDRGPGAEAPRQREGRDREGRSREGSTGLGLRLERYAVLPLINQVQRMLNPCPSARMGVQTEGCLRRDPAGRARLRARSWVEGIPECAGGEALSPSLGCLQPHKILNGRVHSIRP